ncbi:MAG TPA: exodeoxyribonuclease V subunit alpha, partial [Aeromonadales bacterium]|nr:exodeoxyribonuclease V subunit alpha [Aeromonadales bacterium]
GLIWPDKNGKLSAWFENEDGQYRKISLARLPSVETVYTMTIHKTQGSEFNHVAIILPGQEYPLLSPELLYTGLTRAREHLYIIGSETVWKAALTERTWRYSGLRTRLNN